MAAPCKAIQADPELVYEHTNKWNTIAVISDGTRVLGLGDIGPKAALPVMEGKALLFKYLGGVDAVPICLDTKDPDRFIETVLLLQPSFGGVNLEGANLTGTNLNDAFLGGANLKHANLQGAYLRNAQVRNADLTGADLTGARLTGAVFQGCEVADAKLPANFVQHA